MHPALLEHVKGGWPSPYLKYVSSIRTWLLFFKASSDPKVSQKIIYDHFLQNVNAAVVAHKWILPLKVLRREPYVSENVLSSVITEFKYENEAISNQLCAHLHRF